MAVKIYSLKKQKLLVERKIKRCKKLKIKRFKNELNIQAGGRLVGEGSAVEWQTTSNSASALLNCQHWHLLITR